MAQMVLTKSYISRLLLHIQTDTKYISCQSSSGNLLFPANVRIKDAGIEVTATIENQTGQEINISNIKLQDSSNYDIAEAEVFIRNVPPEGIIEYSAILNLFNVVMNVDNTGQYDKV